MAIYNRLSIRLIGATLGLLLLTWVLLVVDRMQVETEALTSQLASEGQTIANAVASAAASHADARAVEPYARRLMAVQIDAARIRIIDNDGQPLVDIQKGEPAPDDLHYTSPVSRDGRRLGTVKVALTQARIQVMLDQRLRAYMAMNLAAFALVALILALLIRQLVGQPLEQLATQARSLGRGDLNIPVELDSKTELGDLARRLDEMRRHLKTNQRILTATNTKLNDALTSLDIALDEAHAASRAKGNFLATMSHEIRTPMNGVLGMAEVLRGMELSDEQRAVVDTIYNSAEALLSIINDILDFSKIEAGKLEMEELAFDLRAAIEEVLELLVVQGQGKPLELLMRYPSDLPRRVVGDAVRIRQVLTNLVGNAIKFTAEGSVLIDVECESLREGRATLVLKVTDTGIGISADMLGGIFERFTQADSSTTRNYGGTGLGLAITQRLVELMGGKIGVDSVYGAGSTFWFRLTMPVVGGPPAPVPALSHLRALVVDDSELAREVLGAQLTELGLPTVSPVRSAPDALQILQLTTTPEGREFDLVLIDDEMPDVSGRELAKMLDAEDRFAPLMLVLMVQRGADERTAQLPVDAVLVKPVRQDELERAIRTAIDRQGAGRESTEPPSVELPEVPAAPAASATDEGPLSGNRVLLVEDNRVNQKVAKSLLGKLGVEVIVAANGQEGVEKSMAGDFDAILMDCQMPVMDGFEATREIRHWEHLALERTPIIAMTANAMEGDRERCLEAGMDDYLAKPIKRAALEEMLARWLSPRIPRTDSAAELEALAGSGAFDPLSTVELEIDPELETLVPAEPSRAGAVDTRSYQITPELEALRKEMADPPADEGA